MRRASERQRAAADENSTKPADTPHTRQAKNGQSSDTGESVASAPEVSAETATNLSADFVAVAEALTVEMTNDASPDANAPALTGQPADGSDIADTNLVSEATIADPVIVAVAAPVPARPDVTATEPTPDPTPVAAVKGPAVTPVLPAESAASDAATPTTTPAAADGSTTPAKQAASDAATTDAAAKTTSADDAQKAAALKAAGISETPETKPTADRKTHRAAATSDRHAGVAHTTDARASQDAPKPTDPAGQSVKAPGPHQPLAPSPEHAAPPRPALGDARADVTIAPATPAQVNASAPSLPFNLAVPAAMSVPAMWSIPALRVDAAAADNAIPVAGLAVEIVSRAHDGLRRFEIRLDPPELGRIDVRLDVDTAGKVTSRLVVERAETLDLLRRDAPQLERALQHAGLNTEGGLEFSLRDQNSAGREQAPRDVAAARLIIPDDEAAAAEAARRHYGRLIGLGGGVDIRV